MFKLGEIWGYPTDTSFGLGVRADDARGLERLNELKGERTNKFFSLMCRDEAMLRQFAKVPKNFDAQKFFFDKPRTAIFAPSAELPKSKYWPSDKVGFRIATIPEIAEAIEFPITATSANLTGEQPIFSIAELQKTFGNKIKIFELLPSLTERPSSEIWDFSQSPAKQMR